MDSYSLRSVADLPSFFQSVFRFRYFNSLQSECFSSCFLSNINMVISAPTGSGKTVLFELCILNLLARFLTPEGKFNHSKGILKTIYIAPSKALVQEKLQDWNMKFGSWGVSCLEMTGDNESYNLRSLQDADIILSTPEKFDSMTRCGIRDGGLSFFGDIALVLIDEVHLLNDPRGAVLEAVVSRIKILSRRVEMRHNPLSSVRFLAVSATVPNIEDLAEWLLVPHEGIKRYGEEMRPVKLITRVIGYAPAKNDFLFEKRLQNFIFDVLMQHSRGKSALVFCSTRKGAQESAQHLSQIALNLGASNPFIKSRQQLDNLKEASLSCSDKLMQSCIVSGVGFHNGGLCMKDRNLVEGLFLRGDLQLLCTTNTLAHGINLPAHTVVLKSTQYFNKEKGLYLEYDRSMVLQMCGRAGRPPFDDTGMVIIMTRRETVHLYENLLNGCELVESQLFSCALEHLNAEIVQLTVSDISLAVEWLKCSYLYVRIKKNPENYGVKRGIRQEQLEKHMRDILVQKVNELSEYGLISIDEDAFLLKPLEPGRLMTKYYLKFGTMKIIMQTPGSCSLEDALGVICRSEEIDWIQLRRNEKKLLNDTNCDKESRLRFHVLSENRKRKKRIQTKEEKIFVLVNDCLTGDPYIHDLSLTQDVNSICSSGYRIAKCMKDCFIYRKSYRGALNSAFLAKSLRQRIWDNSPYLLKQLPGIGMVTAKALCSAGVNSFQSLVEADPRKIEIVTGRKYPFGNHIKESLSSLPPKVEIQIEEIERKGNGTLKVAVKLTRTSNSVPSSKQHFADLLVGSEEDNVILFHEKIRAQEFSSPYVATILVSFSHQGNITVKADLLYQDFVGVDVHDKLVITGSRCPSKPRELKALAYTIPKEIYTIEDHDSEDLRKPGELKAPAYTIPKEIYTIEDDDSEDPPSKTSPAVERRESFKAVETPSYFIPSFNLLEEELAEEPPSHCDPEEEINQSPSHILTSEEAIFDHIRKKSRGFQAPTASKAMAASYEPLILSRKRKATEEAEPANVAELGGLYDPDNFPATRTASPDIRRIVTSPKLGCFHTPRAPRQVSFLGFKSVFSFL